MSLAALGWDDRLQAIWPQHAAEGAQPGRVATLERGGMRLLLEDGEALARSSGNIQKALLSERPAVGDWVVARTVPGDERLAVTAVLPRRSAFTRRAAGDHDIEQVVAANIDTLFLVTGLDDDFNVRRIERALSLAWQSGAAPVILLNKVDVTAEAAARRAEVEAVANGAPIHVVSARHGHGMGDLQAYLQAGSTITLIGSSGAGKSTLVNRLLGEDIQRTQEVRSSDSRGRHTTTRRELFLLPSGAWIVDTPGMRELQLWAESDSVDQTFGDVVELSATCRFTNCQHKKEPGCAVQAAVETGALPPSRLASYQKLQDELAALHGRLTVQGRQEKKKHDKAIHTEQKKFYKRRG